MAGYGEYISIPGLKATSALTQYSVVKPSSTAGEVKAATAATDEVVGIVQNDAGAGENADIGALGVVKALAEASVGYGDALMCSATSRVKTASTANNQVIGIALEASSTAGDIIRVLANFRSNL